MTMNHVDHRSKVENGNVYTVDTFNLGHYTVERYVTKYSDGNIRKRISVEVSYEDRHENYIPEIYYEDDFYGQKKPRFEIQTTAYGTKDVTEIEKVIAGYQEAIEAVKILNMNFC